MICIPRSASCQRLVFIKNIFLIKNSIIFSSHLTRCCPEPTTRVLTSPLRPHSETWVAPPLDAADLSSMARSRLNASYFSGEFSEVRLTEGLEEVFGVMGVVGE